MRYIAAVTNPTRRNEVETWVYFIALEAVCTRLSWFQPIAEGQPFFNQILSSPGQSTGQVTLPRADMFKLVCFCGNVPCKGYSTQVCIKGFKVANTEPSCVQTSMPTCNGNSWASGLIYSLNVKSWFEGLPTEPHIHSTDILLDAIQPKVTF